PSMGRVVGVLAGFLSFAWLTAEGFDEPAVPPLPPPAKAPLPAPGPPAEKAAKKGGHAAFGDLLDPAARKRKEEPQAPIRVGRPLPKAAVPADAAVRQFEQQFAPHLQRLYKAELYWMRRVCQPSREQYEKIAADTAPAFKATSRKFALLMRGGMVR